LAKGFLRYGSSARAGEAGRWATPVGKAQAAHRADSRSESRLENMEPTASARSGTEISHGLRVAAATWLLALLMFTGGYMAILVSYVLPFVSLAGVVLSVTDLVGRRKWALLGLVLSLAPLLLVFGAIVAMSGGR
jgi:VIT1/CCC1 family predicted Fe2+/Mn2+ transporter